MSSSSSTDDAVEATGLCGLVGYEAEINRAIGVCREARHHNYAFLLTVTKKNIFSYLQNGKHRLQYACRTGNFPLFERLYENSNQKEICNIVTKRGANLLHLLLRNENKTKTKDITIMVQRLLMHPDLILLLNQRDYEGNTPLYLACENGFYEVVQELCNIQTVNLDLPNYDVFDSPRYGFTPLMRAICNGYIPIAKEILKYIDRLDLNRQSNAGYTALYCACMKNRVEIVQDLCRIPTVDLRLPDSNGFSSLMIAAEKGHLAIVNELLQYTDRLDVNHRNRNGWVALISAAEKNQSAVVQRLCEVNSVKLNLKNIFGYTALIMAAEKGHTAVVHELMKHPNRLDTQLYDKRGYTALEVATQKHYTEIIQYLRGGSPKGGGKK